MDFLISILDNMGKNIFFLFLLRKIIDKIILLKINPIKILIVNFPNYIIREDKIYMMSKIFLRQRCVLTRESKNLSLLWKKRKRKR